VTVGGTHEHARNRYLAAKRSVDDRARSGRVLDRLRNAVGASPRVLEVGSGLGFGASALSEWGVEPATYRGVDRDEGVVRTARWLCPRLFERAGWSVERTERGCTVAGSPVGFEQGEALAALRAGTADLVLAQSFLDLVSLGSALDAVRAALVPGGLAYAPITFDGVTLFAPDHPADDAVLRAYHRAIDRETGRDSRAGRHLLESLRRREESLLAVGSSDWIVRPVEGGYRADERYFLDCILGFVADAVEGLAAADVDRWLAVRRRQLERGELTYVAHGYDLLWRTPA
jgi:SAM-dependent methyltransferase